MGPRYAGSLVERDYRVFQGRIEVHSTMVWQANGFVERGIRSAGKVVSARSREEFGGRKSGQNYHISQLIVITTPQAQLSISGLINLQGYQCSKLMKGTSLCQKVQNPDSMAMMNFKWFAHRLSLQLSAIKS
ncbi:Uncharacterized protein HZ326_22188 [Fusarium oxysporum f. sp. albedinis]|nr:Uncharacterized protein HZ326_22188 [Fusarium oxysporum f. sp. albedinis]